VIKNNGGSAEKGAKFLKMAELLPLYKGIKDAKDAGGFHDYLEILKLYDKNADDTMQVSCNTFK
jgi:hypothetical protein